MDESPPEKRQRMEPTPPAEEPKQSTKITGLNDDCLEKVFIRLTLVDLFNVAVANQWLRPAANAVYKRKFGKKEVHLIRVHGIQKSPVPDDDGNSIKIYNFKTCLQFLRCFGSSITHLIITYGQSTSRRYDHMHQYINKYCAKTLVSIKFSGKLPFGIEHFDEPFRNIQYVDIIDCNLGKQFPQILKWFPNIHHLKCHGSHINHRYFIAEPPTQFKHLTIEFNHSTNVDLMERYQRIVDMLQLNRQLQSLTINAKSVHMIMSFLLDMIKGNRLISQLSVCSARTTRVNERDVKRFAHEHPTVVELDLPGFRFTANTVIILLQRLIPLRRFRFNIHSKSVYTNIVSKLNAEWQSTVSGLLVTLNR